MTRLSPLVTLVALLYALPLAVALVLTNRRVIVGALGTTAGVVAGLPGIGQVVLGVLVVALVLWIWQ